MGDGEGVCVGVTLGVTGAELDFGLLVGRACEGESAACEATRPPFCRGAAEEGVACEMSTAPQCAEVTHRVGQAPRGAWGSEMVMGEVVGRGGGMVREEGGGWGSEMVKESGGWESVMVRGEGGGLGGHPSVGCVSEQRGGARRPVGRCTCGGQEEQGQLKHATPRSAHEELLLHTHTSQHCLREKHAGLLWPLTCPSVALTPAGQLGSHPLRTPLASCPPPPLPVWVPPWGVPYTYMYM